LVASNKLAGAADRVAANTADRLRLGSSRQASGGIGFAARWRFACDRMYGRRNIKGYGPKSPALAVRWRASTGDAATIGTRLITFGYSTGNRDCVVRIRDAASNGATTSQYPIVIEPQIMTEWHRAA
jgi:hypothetical protein